MTYRAGLFSPSFGSGGTPAWASITGKPSTFTPAAHSHVIADVTGLQSALDGKQAAGSYAAASHGHVIADVTGLQAALDGKQAAGSYQPLATVLTNTTASFTTALETKLNGLATVATSGAYADLTGKPTLGTIASQGADNVAITGGTINGASVGATTPANGTFNNIRAANSMGFTTGAGGTVAQATSKATAVTLNKATGEITMNAAALAAATIVTFVLNNTAVAVGDQIVCTHHSGGTFGAYTINARVTGAGAASIAVRNNTAGSLSEAVVIKFSVIKAVTA